jgi:hypothetical protein
VRRVDQNHSDIITWSDFTVNSDDSFGNSLALHPYEFGPDDYIKEDQFIVLTELSFTVTFVSSSLPLGDADLMPLYYGFGSDSTIYSAEPTVLGPGVSSELIVGKSFTTECCHNAINRPILFAYYDWLYIYFRFFTFFSSEGHDMIITSTSNIKGHIFDPDDRLPERIIHATALSHTIPTVWMPPDVPSGG